MYTYDLHVYIVLKSIEYLKDLSASLLEFESNAVGFRMVALLSLKQEASIGLRDGYISKKLFLGGRGFAKCLEICSEFSEGPPKKCSFQTTRLVAGHSALAYALPP